VILYDGDARDPASWSGTPRGLSDGLISLGVDLHHVNARLGRLPRRLLERGGGLLHPEQCALQSMIARRQLASIEGVDAVIQIGTGLTIQPNVPTATYEDMTVIQHERYHDEWFMGFASRARRAWKRRQRIAYKNAYACCVTSDWAGKSIIEDYAVPAEKVHVVGVGGNHIISAPTDRDWSVPRFLIVAQDWRRKNVELVVRTFRELRAGQPTATLDVVGPYSGEAGPGVSLHGPLRLDVSAERGRVDALFRQSTCYVMPSTHEASALVFVEASWAGIPSIGTTVGGVRELIGDGGVVVNPDKPLELLDAMRQLSAPAAAAHIGALARRHAEWYTWPRTAERILQALGCAFDAL